MKYLRFPYWGSLILLWLSCSLVWAENENDITPTVGKGALTFKQRCELCHGRDGMGEGRLSLLIKDYENSNIISEKYKGDEITRQIILYGGILDDVSDFMPPWGGELTWTEIESVILYIKLLHHDYKEAVAIYEQVAKSKDLQVTLDMGREVYLARCVLCHGPNADGKGRMAKVIKTPPPANLIISRLPDDYLEKIVVKGGQGVSRSPQMPPWGDELTTEELKSVIEFVKSIRK